MLDSERFPAKASQGFFVLLRQTEFAALCTIGTGVFKNPVLGKRRFGIQISLFSGITLAERGMVNSILCFFQFLTLNA